MSAETIARLNDQLRREVTSEGGSQLGKLTMTAGVAGLSPEVLFLLVRAVREYDNFTSGSEGNDPYGEHDFGTIELDGVGKFYWKIGYYDKNEEYGSEAPEDPEVTTRIMTVMMVEEWLGNTKWPD